MIEIFETEDFREEATITIDKKTALEFFNEQYKLSRDKINKSKDETLATMFT
jgi:hypothetical protein